VIQERERELDDTVVNSNLNKQLECRLLAKA